MQRDVLVPLLPEGSASASIGIDSKQVAPRPIVLSAPSAAPTLLVPSKKNTSLQQLLIHAISNIQEFLHKHAAFKIDEVAEVKAMLALLPKNLLQINAVNFPKRIENLKAQQRAIQKILDDNPITCTMSVLNTLTSCFSSCTAYAVNIALHNAYAEYLKILTHHLKKIESHPQAVALADDKVKVDLSTSDKKSQPSLAAEQKKHSSEDKKNDPVSARPYLGQRGLPTVHENVTNPRASFPVRTASFKHYSNTISNYDGTEGAYVDMMKALHDAKEVILLSGWMFEPQIVYEFGQNKTLGEFLIEKAIANPQLEIAILLWRQFFSVESHDQAFLYLTRIAKKRGCAALPENLQLRYVRRTGLGWSHHQKFLVTDDPATKTLVGFYGSADIRGANMEGADHIILDTADNKDTVTAFFKAKEIFHSAEPRSDSKELADRQPRTPWREIVSRVTGSIAFDFFHEFASRWNAKNAGAFSEIQGSEDTEGRIVACFKKMKHRFESMQALDDAKGPATIWNAQLVRSIERSSQSMRWHLKKPYEKSIHKAYLQMIYQANDFIFIENQYFIGGPAVNARPEDIVNRIPQALVDRIVEQHHAKKPFHVFMMLPMLPNAPPGGRIGEAIRFLQWQTLTWMMKEIEKQTGEYWGTYLTIFFPAQWYGFDKEFSAKKQDAKTTHAELVAHSRRTYIYVHSKMMMADDICMINGSANLNERSMGGPYDSEIGVYQWASPEQEAACKEELRKFRREIWQTYMGMNCLEALGEEGFNAPHLPENVAKIKKAAFTNLGSYMSATEEKGGATPQTGYMLTWPLHKEKGHVGEYANDKVTLLPGTPISQHQNALFKWQPPLEQGPSKTLAVLTCCHFRPFN